MALGKTGKQDMPICDGLPTRMYGNPKSVYMHLGKDWGLDAPFGGGGTLVDGSNLSPRKGSMPATRLPRRGYVQGYGSGTPHGMVIFDGMLIFARGSTIYATTDGSTVFVLTQASDTYKSFVIFGDRLYIYPDKLYMEKDGVPKSLELYTGVIRNATFRDNTITLPAGSFWADYGFETGDSVKVENSDGSSAAPAGYYHIRKIQGGVATLSQYFAEDYTATVRFRREIPDLTSCCVCGDRVYGIAGNRIHVSASGSATDFYSDPMVNGSHAAILSSDAEGDFTALSPWQGYVICFKSDRICKLLGSRADSFTLQDRQGVGVPAVMSRTLCEVGDALYYASLGGVWRYRGQEPEWVCSFGGATAKAGCGGTDGRAYYLSVNAGGKERLCLYLPEERKWYPEDNMRVSSMFCHDGLLWMQGQTGIVWTSASDGRSLGLGIFEEDLSGPVISSMTLATDRTETPARIRPMTVWIRATGQEGSLKVYASYADGAACVDATWEEEILLGEFSAPMSDRLLTLPVLAGLCDAAAIRLETTGDWVIHDVIRRYEVVQL